MGDDPDMAELAQMMKNGPNAEQQAQLDSMNAAEKQNSGRFLCLLAL